MFEEILTECDKQDIKGGALYVTLEPCNKRRAFLDKNHKKMPKIPCAVRCVESGISDIYIGTYDPNQKVNWKGIEILETGSYIFTCSNGAITAENKNQEEIEAATLLKNYFDKKHYEVMQQDDNLLKYKIGNSINVNFFHPDLSIEIMNLNADFIGANSKQAFPYSRSFK